MLECLSLPYRPPPIARAIPEGEIDERCFSWAEISPLRQLVFPGAAEAATKYSRLVEAARFQLSALSF